MEKCKKHWSYGTMSVASSSNDMVVHSQLYPYPQKMHLEREEIYQEEVRFQAPFATHRLFGVQGCSWLLLVYVAFYVLYLATGGLVFAALEAPMENQERLGVLRAKADFLATYPAVDADRLESLLEQVVKASSRGVSAARNVSSEPNWTFGQALFFSSTVVTTIGYGHVTPLSKTGKIFCMIYAMVGIPLTLVLLSALVERLLLPATWLLQTLNSKLGHLYQPFNIRVLHLFIIVSIMVTVFLAAPASLFAAIEPDWDFLDSFYYCFISLTTIGLGDFIPGDTPNQPYRPLYKAATTAYLLLGLTFMMLTLTVFYDIPQLNLGTVFAAANKMDDSERDPEKMRLSGGGMIGPQYTVGGLTLTDAFGPHAEERRHVVRIRSHRDDSPSPEDTTPVHARDIRVH